MTVPNNLPDVRFPPSFGDDARQSQWERLASYLRAAAPKFGQHFLAVDELFGRSVVDTRADYERSSADAARLYEECVVAAAQMPMGLYGPRDASFLHDAGATALRLVCTRIKSLRDNVEELAGISVVEEEQQEDIATQRHADNLDAMIDELLAACACRRALDKYKHVRAQEWPRDPQRCKQLEEQRKREVTERPYRTFVNEWLAVGQIQRLKRLSGPALRILAGCAGLADDDVDWIVDALQGFVCTFVEALACVLPGCLTSDCALLQCFHRRSSGPQPLWVRGRHGFTSTCARWARSCCVNAACWPSSSSCATATAPLRPTSPSLLSPPTASPTRANFWTLTKGTTCLNMLPSSSASTTR